MATDWPGVLTEQGAVLDEASRRVLHFGNPRAELEAALEHCVLVDRSDAGRLLVATTLLASCGCGARQITADVAYFPPPPAEPHAVHIKSFNQLHDLVPSQPSLLEVLRGGTISPFVDTPAGIAFRDRNLPAAGARNLL